MQQKTEQIDEKEKFKQRLHEHFKSRMEDLKILDELEFLEQQHEKDFPLLLEKLRNEHGQKCEYGLGLDFVEAGTFQDQREDYIRFQLSWGGPSEEFRFYKNGDCEFWFLDWFKGECQILDDGEKETVLNFLGAFDYEELYTYC